MLLSIREIQIKISMRYHFTPVRVAILKRQKWPVLVRCGGGSPRALWAGTSVGAVTVENSVEVPQKFKNRTTTCSAILLRGIYLKKMKTLKKIYAPRVHCGIIYSSQDVEAI